MHMFRSAVAGALAVSMMAGATAATAAPTRSAAALLKVQPAPVAGVRSATTLNHANYQSDGSPAIGYVLAAVMAAGIVAAVIVGTDNKSHYPPFKPASPG